MRHFTVIADLNVAQKNNLEWWPIFFSAYFIPVYVSFIIVKNCVFVIGFVIFSNIFSFIKQFFVTIFNVKA